MDTSDFDIENVNIATVKALFFKIVDIISNNISNEEYYEFYEHVLEKLLEEDEDKEHHHIPVFHALNQHKEYNLFFNTNV